tara:strand:- start:458 stop:712 length:255 start_codon:yes stop_codon:yes gene_type:complete
MEAVFLQHRLDPTGQADNRPAADLEGHSEAARPGKLDDPRKESVLNPVPNESIRRKQAQLFTFLEHLERSQALFDVLRWELMFE